MGAAFKVVVDSIGTAGPGIGKALAKVVPLGPEALLAKLYQAPSVLVEDLTEEIAEGLCRILDDAGLRTRALPADAPVEAGAGDREVALWLADPMRLREVVAELARFLGADAATAARILWSSPSAALGNVSAATVEALRERLEPLGVELDVSVYDEAVYDLFVGECSAAERTVAASLLKDLGVEVAPEGPLLAMGLDRTRALAAWQRLEKRAPVHMLAQDFQRFDVRLDAAPTSPEVRALLLAQTGMPEAVADKALERLPLVLHQGVRHARLGELLAAWAALGAEATAHLVTFQSFDLMVDKASDHGAAVDLVQALTGRDKAEVSRAMARLPARVPGPFTAPRARWMRTELKRAGVRARMELR